MTHSGPRGSFTFTLHKRLDVYSNTSSASASSVGGAPTLCPTFVPCAHTYLLVFDLRNCRNCGDAGELFCRSLTVTDPQRRNVHACTSVGYFLVYDNGCRGLLWGRFTSDTGRASEASRLAAQTGLRTFSRANWSTNLRRHWALRRPLPAALSIEQQTESFIIKDATGRGSHCCTRSCCRA
jgi:hypothetical protein